MVGGFLKKFCEESGRFSKFFRVGGQALVFFAVAVAPARLSLAQTAKPDLAVAPIATLGKFSEVQKGIIFNGLLSRLSKTYKLVSQENFSKAQERAFQDLDLAKCTEEQCIRKIQELLQVGRLMILQMLKEDEFVQLTLILVRHDDKVVHSGECERCKASGLNTVVGSLVQAIASDDLGINSQNVKITVKPPIPDSQEDLAWSGKQKLKKGEFLKMVLNPRVCFPNGKAKLVMRGMGLRDIGRACKNPELEE